MQGDTLRHQWLKEKNNNLGKGVLSFRQEGESGRDDK